MVKKRHLDPEVLHKELRRALRHGARASRLAKFTPELIELLVPAHLHPATSLPERAIYTENLIHEALKRIGGVHSDVLAILLCLAPGTLGTTLEARRQRATALLGILPDTLCREHHEGLMLWDLAWELQRLAERPQVDS